MKVTYEQLKPIIIAESWTENNVVINFKAPGHTAPIMANGSIDLSSSGSVAGTVGNVAKQNLIWSVFSRLGSAIGSALGGGIGGAVAGHTAADVGRRGTEAATNKAGENMRKKRALSPKAKEEAVVKAFASIAMYFEYNEDTKEWKGLSAEEAAKKMS